MDDFVEIHKYIASVFRWWWLIILTSVVSGVIGLEVSKRQPPVYQATTTIIVGQSIQSIDLTKADIQTSALLAQTYAIIAQRQPVLQGVIDRLNLNSTARGLKKRVQVKPIEGTQLIEISVEANSPEEARDSADEVAHQLILQSPTHLQDEEEQESQRFIRQRLESLQARIEDGQQRLETLESNASSSPSAEEIQALQKEINTLERLISDWESSYTQLQILAESKKSSNYLSVIEPAQVSSTPIRPKPKLNTILASAVGFFLALGFIFLKEYLDDTLKSVDDLNEHLGLISLGTINHIKGKNLSNKPFVTQDPFSPVSESYRMIRSNIQFMSVDRPAKSIMVTSPTPHEGKSTTVANLGIVMAQVGLKTIIVDTDLRRPTQHQIFQVPNLGGVTDLLRVPEPDLNGYLRRTDVENLSLVTAGILPPNPSELLSSQRMKQVLGKLNKLADVVIFDSPPVLAVTDAAVLSNRVDGVVLVIQAGQTRRNVARQAILNLQHAGANLLGGVLNQIPQKGTTNTYYYSYTAHNKREPTGQPKLVGQWRRWRWLPFFK